ncbi:MAG: tetratricopeptide repeat protein [Ignavibacteriae bacterium]|nr:tetratricopeptide repeat protein [Ignavibacteriota bacterium]
MKKFSKYPAFLFFLFLLARISPAQINYEFDFNKKWEWFDLYSSEPAISNGLIKHIQALSEDWTVEEGRTLFRNLAKLDSLNELHNLQKVIDTDSNAGKNLWKHYTARELKYFNEPQTFRGIITAAIVVSKIRKSIFPDRKIFANRNFYIKITDKIDTSSHISFNLNGAADIYNLCITNDVTEKEIAFIDTSSVLKSVFRKKSPYFNRDLFVAFLKLSKNKQPLYEIYKLMNPYSYGGLGFTAAHLPEFRNVISSVNKYQQNLKFYSINLLSQFFPVGAWLEANVFFFFGNVEEKSAKTSLSHGEEYQEKLLVNLATIGDDYEYLAKYMTRRLFIYEKYNTQLDIFPYIFSDEDTLIYQLMNEVYEGGISNYMAPILEENRPLSLMEIDFYHFKSTTSAILFKKKKNVIDSLLKAGLEGRFLFYTMGAQMAYSIDRTLGRTALTEALIYGPLEFFKIYIDAYETDKKQITDKFRFNSDMEKKIYSMRKKVPKEIYKMMFDMNVKYRDPAPIPGELEKLKKNYMEDKEDSFYFYLIGGQLLFDNDFYAKSLGYFEKVLNELPDKNYVARKLGMAYYGKGAYEQAAAMLGYYVRYSPLSADPYLLRGKSYFMLKQYGNAKTDFEKALQLNPAGDEAKQLLEQVKENGF